MNGNKKKYQDQEQGKLLGVRVGKIVRNRNRKKCQELERVIEIGKEKTCQEQKQKNVPGIGKSFKNRNRLSNMNRTNCQE